jgi:hypothetical protein
MIKAKHKLDVQGALFAQMLEKSVMHCNEPSGSNFSILILKNNKTNFHK